MESALHKDFGIGVDAKSTANNSKTFGEFMLAYCIKVSLPQTNSNRAIHSLYSETLLTFGSDFHNIIITDTSTIFYRVTGSTM